MYLDYAGIFLNGNLALLEIRFLGRPSLHCETICGPMWLRTVDGHGVNKDLLPNGFRERAWQTWLYRSVAINIQTTLISFNLFVKNRSLNINICAKPLVLAARHATRARAESLAPVALWAVTEFTIVYFNLVMNL